MFEKRAQTFQGHATGHGWMGTASTLAAHHGWSMLPCFTCTAVYYAFFILFTTGVVTDFALALLASPRSAHEVWSCKRNTKEIFRGVCSCSTVRSPESARLTAYDPVTGEQVLLYDTFVAQQYRGHEIVIRY